MKRRFPLLLTGLALVLNGCTVDNSSTNPIPVTVVGPIPLPVTGMASGQPPARAAALPNPNGVFAVGNIIIVSVFDVPVTKAGIYKVLDVSNWPWVRLQSTDSASGRQTVWINVASSPYLFEKAN